ncbi:serine/threonine protein kinase [candidate division WOR-3 bacterium]|nr:serine/threonine protein kinase [candidate division WOR-3 bacterium]
MYYGDHTMVSRNPNPGDRIREYEILETIGKGGMATVYKARHSLIDQTVAIKIMKPSLMDDQQFCERFIREAQAQAKLTGHPNIVTIHNLFEEDNLYIIVMEYVDGMFVDGSRIRTLAQFIEHRGTLSVEQFKPILEGMVSGLMFAHEHNVVHRDIKPSNIMLTGNGTVKIVDFGIARSITDQRLTKTGIAIGTPKYMSPEQVRSSRIDARSDIYSVGITMYEALTGGVPFKGDTDYEIMRQHEDTLPPLPRSIKPDIPKTWEDMILMCIAKDPAQRPQSVHDIQSILVGEKKARRPIITEEQDLPEEPGEKPRTTGGHHRPPVLTARIVGAAAILCLLMIVYYFAVHLPGQRMKDAVYTLDSLPTDTLPGDIILKKYADIGKMITASSYVISAFIMCSEDNLNEIIIQIIGDEPDMVYIHFTDNGDKVVASSNASAIGAEYRSDILTAEENTVRRRNGFYEGAFTVSAEENILGALYFSAREPDDETAVSRSDLEVLRYTSIGNFISHSPEIEEAVIQHNVATLNGMIMAVQREIPDLKHLHITDKNHRVIASSDTTMINTNFPAGNESPDGTVQDTETYNGEFRITVSDIQIGVLVLGARLHR